MYPMMMQAAMTSTMLSTPLFRLSRYPTDDKLSHVYSNSGRFIFNRVYLFSQPAKHSSTHQSPHIPYQPLDYTSI